MAEKNLELVRIDDRLIHGQVVTAWLHAYASVRHIIVVDDKTSGDPFMRKMLALLVPAGITIEVLDVDAAVRACEKNLDRPSMMIVKDPLTIKRLVDAGVDIDFVNVGGMGMSAERTRLFQNVAASPQERDILRELVERGVRVEIQIVPAQRKVDVSQLLG